MVTSGLHSDKCFLRSNFEGSLVELRLKLPWGVPEEKLYRDAGASRRFPEVLRSDGQRQALLQANDLTQ